MKEPTHWPLSLWRLFPPLPSTSFLFPPSPSTSPPSPSCTHLKVRGNGRVVVDNIVALQLSLAPAKLVLSVSRNKVPCTLCVCLLCASHAVAVVAVLAVSVMSRRSPLLLLMMMLVPSTSTTTTITATTTAAASSVHRSSPLCLRVSVVNQSRKMKTASCVVVIGCDFKQSFFFSFFC